MAKIARRKNKKIESVESESFENKEENISIVGTDGEQSSPLDKSTKKKLKKVKKSKLKKSSTKKNEPVIKSKDGKLNFSEKPKEEEEVKTSTIGKKVKKGKGKIPKDVLERIQEEYDSQGNLINPDGIFKNFILDLM